MGNLPQNGIAHFTYGDKTLTADLANTTQRQRLLGLLNAGTATLINGIEPALDVAAQEKDLDLQAEIDVAAPLSASPGIDGVAPAVDNEAFLRAIFFSQHVTQQDVHREAHVASFMASPDKLQGDREASARAWAGGRFDPRAARPKVRIDPMANNYFVISMFQPSEEEEGRLRARRRKALFVEMRCVVVDDVGTKVRADDPRLPPPSWALMTSPGNWQWGYILDKPCGELALASGILKGMVARGLTPDSTDPGMTGVTRYVRLPVGHNRKSALLELDDAGFRCTLTSWHPERRYSIEQLLAAFNMTEEDARREGDSAREGPYRVGTVANDPALQALNEIGIYQGPASGGWHHVECPWIDEHTERQDDGAAVILRPDGSIGFKCHHKHGNKLHGPDLEQWLEQKHPEQWAQIRLAAAQGVFSAMPVVDPDDEAIEAPAGPTQAAEAWPEPVDLFAAHPVPEFPLDAVPVEFADFAQDMAAGSGFDAGSYCFSLLVTASGLIDHRSRIQFGPMSQPPMLWGALNDASGGGKTPVMNAATAHAEVINKRMVHESLRLRSLAAVQAKADKTPAVHVPLRQMLVHDTTVEALARVLQDNPEGVLVLVPEMSEFIGKMDAFAKASAGSSKDRGAWLKAYDGVPVVINRVSSPTIVVDSFSTAILTGVQPERLAQMFVRRGGEASDGLFQRFLTYCGRAPLPVNYRHLACPVAEAGVAAVFDQLAAMRSMRLVAQLAPECLPAAEGFHNRIRELAIATPDARLAEHLGKFPGFLARLTLVMHVLEHATHPELVYGAVVSPAVFDRALRLLNVLWRHSEAAYAAMSSDGAYGAMSFVRSAAEAVLSKGWARVQQADLTRHATGWQGADDRQREMALVLLMDLGWFRDVTPARAPGQRGRRSQGVFAVNPAVHEVFKGHAARITGQRARRAAAIQKSSEAREGNKLG